MDEQEFKKDLFISICFTLFMLYCLVTELDTAWTLLNFPLTCLQLYCLKKLIDTQKIDRF